MIDGCALLQKLFRRNKLPQSLPYKFGYQGRDF